MGGPRFSFFSSRRRTWWGRSSRNSAAGAQPRINAYDNGILQADHSIQELFSKLDAKGYLQNSIVMILGDHGDAFGEHGIFGHTLSVYQETMHIPLLIYDTDTAARYPNLDFATQSDIAPTILGRLGLPKPADWQGVSLISQPPQTFSTYWTDRARPWHAVLYRSNDRIYKYMYVVRWGSRAEELYELSSDPGEKTNLIAQAGLSSVLAAVRGRAAARWPIDFQ
jgi:arylsulfatase A-like enzyme